MGEKKKKLLIIGASGHGKVVADIAMKSGYEEIAFLDDDKYVKFCMGFPVVGTTDSIDDKEESDVVVAIGNSVIREKLQQKLCDKGLNVVTLIHPDAVIGQEVSIGIGTVIMAGTKVGKGCIINTGATVDHDNEIGDFAHVSVGSHLAGTVRVGERSWVGAGAVVSNNITICADCVIGAGAVVVRNIDKQGTYIGVPANVVQ